LIDDLSRYIDAIVSVDRNSLNYVLPKFRSKWHVIYNCVDLKLFNPFVKPPKADTGERIDILVPRNLRFERGVSAIPEIAIELEKRPTKP